jgi:hypothetical protein
MRGGFKMKQISEYYFQQFKAIACALEPENLSCNGECTKKVVALRKSKLKMEWKQLENQLGFKVSFSGIRDEILRREGI